MAETDSYATINNPLLPQNPNKFYTHFLYKAILVSIFLLLLPLFPSEAPGFINHTINNRSWELLQFVFVGIAVSYGLFSKRNDDDTEKEKEQMGSINTQSYVARLLQVSSVFDDDSENTKVQTWNSQYYRGEPIIVVAKETSLPDGHTTLQKPLLLPVRNLKNGVCESFSRSDSRLCSINLSKVSPEEESQENIVLRSPIPWRSRSGRMEVKEDYSQSSEKSNPCVSSEIQSKSQEDAGRKKMIHKSSFTPIPPPPPPPLPLPHVKTYTKNRMNWNPCKEFARNEGRRGGESRMASGNQDEYLSDDKEIERFIERRESQNKRMMNETYPKGEEDEKEKKENMKTENDSDEEELVELASKNNGETMVGNEDAPDVDKKADEFIAKFREQIRLQRIASIRRTTSSTPPKHVKSGR